jgi:nucleoside-diphosphate-sugar epimerase
VNEVYRLVSSHMGLRVQADHAASVPGELRFSVADISKARRLLGYQPVHDLAGSLGPVVDEILADRTSAIAP